MTEEPDYTFDIRLLSIFRFPGNLIEARLTRKQQEIIIIVITNQPMALNFAIKINYPKEVINSCRAS